MTVKTLYVLTTVKRGLEEIGTLRNRGEYEKAQAQTAGRVAGDNQTLNDLLADGFTILFSSLITTARTDSVLFILHKPDPVKKPRQPRQPKKDGQL